MKEISVKQISIILLSLIFLLIISIVIGGRLQIYFLQKYNGDLMLAQEVKNKLLELNLALEESLMPVYNYLITGTVDYEEQKQLEKNVQDKFNSLLNIISTDSHKEYIEILSPYHDSMSVFINKIIDYENLIVNDMVGTQERINIMEATNESVENYMLIYNKYTNNIDNIINKIKYPMNVKLRIAVIIVLIFASILVFTIFFIFIKFITHMNKFLYNYEHFLETVTKEKNFKARIDSLPITEIKHIILLLNNFLKELNETFIVFNQHSNELAAFSEELSASSEEISSATEEVASSTELITEEISSVKDNTDDIKGNVNDLQELMNQTEGYLNKSKSINEEFMKLMSNETNLIDDSSNKFDEMEESLKNVQLFIDDFSNQINTIQESVDSIKNIHKKIELLSLNAAIEAARAGKEGGGFAVIAEEIRSLSSRSAEASGEIEKVMGDVISNIKQLHQLINQSMDGFINIQKEWSVISDISTKIQGESTVSYEESMKINKHISDLKNRFTFVNDSFIEIIKKIETIVSTSEEISSSNEEISSQMEELAASSEQLSSKARTIKEFIDQYKL